MAKTNNIELKSPYGHFTTPFGVQIENGRKGILRQDGLIKFASCDELVKVPEHWLADDLTMKSRHTVKVRESDIQKAVDEILNTNDWPIYKTQDDNGLEESEYFEFARAVCRKLGLVGNA